MILVDTSVWVAHFRAGVPELRALLENDQVFTHPFVIGELACGGLRNRGEILDLLERLPQAQFADHHEVMALIASRRLYGRGIGWIDAHLLSASLLSHVNLWTFDRSLARAAGALGLAHR